MNEGEALRALAAREQTKCRRALELFLASVDGYVPYDPNQPYTAKELEPYDALSDRFIRAVEAALKFFRSYERFNFGEFSETVRDLLGRMEKVGLISGVGFWIDMRDLRNRVVHDYLPEQLVRLYGSIVGECGPELAHLSRKLEDLGL